MSGPVTDTDAPSDHGEGSHVEPPCAEISDAREATVGTMAVRRVLPRRQRRTVGAWCFVDHFGPAAVEEDGGIDIGPHPHTGLHTVTYLLDGQVLHRDSLGSEQVIRPGQLNLMTAGRGLSHAEEPTGHYRGTLHGVQLWVAQPEATRHDAPAFAHHEELPRIEAYDAEITVLVGDLEGSASAARQDTPLVGLDVALRPGQTTLPLARGFEHVLVVLDGLLLVDGERPVTRGQSAYLGAGRDEVTLGSPDGARVLLLGGEPFEEPVLMWWNFVARTREEIVEAQRQWAGQDERFGRVDSPLARVPSPPVPWSTPS